MRHHFIVLVFLLAFAASSLSPSLSSDGDEALTWSIDENGKENTDNVSAVKVDAFPDGLDASQEQSLLMWAIANSNSEKAHPSASVLVDDMSLDEKRARVKLLREIVDRQGQVSDTQMMKDIIKRLEVTSNGDEGDQAGDLLALLPFVESIDNANDLKPLGALKLLIDSLDSRHWEARAAGASVIGKAASNNIKFKRDLVDFDPLVIERLISMTRQGLGQGHEYSVYQGLYAIGSMFTLTHYSAVFYESKGFGLLSECLGHQSFRVKRKALTLIADFNELGLELEEKDLIARLISEGIDKMEDSDYIEKTLVTVLSLADRDHEWIRRFESHHLGSKVKHIQEARSQLQEEDEDGNRTQLLTEVLRALHSDDNQKEL